MSSRNVSRKAVSLFFVFYIAETKSVLFQVQVRPWQLKDFVHLPDPSALIDPRNTVFIGGVPRPTRASKFLFLFMTLYASVFQLILSMSLKRNMERLLMLALTLIQNFVIQKALLVLFLINVLIMSKL